MPQPSKITNKNLNLKRSQISIIHFAVYKKIHFFALGNPITENNLVFSAKFDFSKIKNYFRLFQHFAYKY